MGKAIRFIAILFMALTAGFTLLGGVGTSCVAINPTGFGESMALLAPFQWLYILFVLLTVAVGATGILVTVRLIRGESRAYHDALWTLAAGVVLGGFHMGVSRNLRGSSMPVDAIVYVTVLTLALFLVLRLPGIWKVVDFSQGKSGGNGKLGDRVSIMLGVLCLVIQLIAGPSHTWGGVNYADAFHAIMIATGIGLIAIPAARSLRGARKRSLQAQVDAG